MKKHRLWDMSWKEAEEAFKRSDTVILPVGTLHGHGPTPISIDSSSVERLADEVGKRTGLVTLPVVAYGENDKMREYPGSIAISQHVLEGYYTDICRSLYRNGIRKIIFLNGHGGNREVLLRTGRTAREFGMLTVIVEWWTIGKKIKPLGFTDFEYNGGPIIIPVDAWEIDVDSPPEVSESVLDDLRRRGEETINRLADYIAGFAREFERTAVSKPPVKA